MDTIPTFSEDLIKALEAVFPPLTAKPVSPDELAHFNYMAGQRSVVDFLQMRLEQTKEEEFNV